FFSSDETQIKMLFQMQENVGIIILTFNALQKWHVIYLKLAMPKINSRALLIVLSDHNYTKFYCKYLVKFF
ncbi:hypothetical protein EZS27_010520, partial [termite gut metagenome]